MLCLGTRRQQPGESLDEYLNALKLLAKDCTFKDVTAIVYQQEMIRDAFINGLQIQHIHRRLLENATLTLDDQINEISNKYTVLLILRMLTIKFLLVKKIQM